MNRILIGLAASALMLSVSAGAFAQGNTGGSTGTGVGGTGSGGASEGNTQGGSTALTPEEQKKKDAATKGATSGAASTSDNTDASQSKRTGDDKPANSGSK